MLNPSHALSLGFPLLQPAGKTLCSYGRRSLCQAHLNSLPNLRSTDLGLELHLQNPFTPIPRLRFSEELGRGMGTPGSRNPGGQHRILSPVAPEQRIGSCFLAVKGMAGGGGQEHRIIGSPAMFSPSLYLGLPMKLV